MEFYDNLRDTLTRVNLQENILQLIIKNINNPQLWILMTMLKLKKIVSGGQTGADRAGLDAAMELNIPTGGWCPKGRKAEDGPIDEKYPLQETKSGDYKVRTNLNVKESDGTLIFTIGKPTGGTALTLNRAQTLKKPHLVIDLEMSYNYDAVQTWLIDNHIEVLNIAGPRGSQSPDIYEKTRKFLKTWLGTGMSF